MVRKFPVVLFLLVSLVFSGTLLSGSNPGITKIILVRHGEKKDGSKDPSLTPAGQKRALELVYILKHVPLDAVYSTPYQRNLETVFPLAKDRGIKVTKYQPGNEGVFIARILDKFKGGTVLVAGHSNTVPRLLNVILGENTFKDIPDVIYDNLFIAVISSGGDVDVSHLRFGTHSLPGKN